MARASRPFLFALFLIGLASALHAAGGLRIITAANVTVRQTPSPQAPAVAQLPLGSEVSEAGDADLDKTWVRVTTTDGKTGWVLANLARRIDPFWKGQTQEQLISERLARKGDGFAAEVELVNFIERISKDFSDPDAAARMDLNRLRALQMALNAIPFRGDTRDPYRSWLARNKDLAVYSEPGGQWMLANKAIWKVHDARMNTMAADDIAWFSTTAGLPGECEGYVPCYLDVRNMLQGEYLRRHPTGAHVVEAISQIRQTAALVSVPPTDPRSAYSFNATQDCKTFVPTVDALRKAIEGALRTSEREPALAALAALRKKCG